MNTETVIKQAVLEAFNEKSSYWLSVTDTQERESFAKQVLLNCKRIESELIEKRIRDNTIPVDMNEVDASYEDGFQTGLNWIHDYVPGGPFRYSAGEYESDRSKAMAAQTQAEHAAWMQGWHDGKATKN
jgi:hypothetical protein